MKVKDLTIEQKAEIFYLYRKTLMTLVEIRRMFNIPQYQFNDFKVLLISEYGLDFYNDRYKKQLSITKLNKRNPMYGKIGNNHPNYKGLVEDGHGYYMILKPDWYTGRKGCKHIFYHHYVMCQYLGITEIPDGFVVHHIDLNPKNNDINNFQLMTIQAHNQLHAKLRKCRDYPKGVEEKSSKRVTSID